MGGQFTPEQMKALGLAPAASGVNTPHPELQNPTAANRLSQATQDQNVYDPSASTSGGQFTDTQQRQLDVDEGPIKRQPEAQIFDGSTYEQKDQPTPTTTTGIAPIDIADSLVNKNEFTTRNQELYSKAGDSSIGPVRFQHATDPETGEKSNYFVPPPGMTPATRIATGGALDAVKATGSFVEWAVKAVPDAVPYFGLLKNSLHLADLLGHPEVSDQHVNWFNEQFPTMPAQNEFERGAQEITSIGIGAIMGGGLADAAAGTPSAIKAVQKLAGAFFKKTVKADPANAIQKTQAFVKSALVELGGANAGATIASPPNTGSITGPEFAKMGMDPKIADRLGIFADNTLLSAAGGTVAKALGKTGSTAKKLVFEEGKRLPRTEGEVTIDLLHKIDPDLKNASDSEVARRGKILSDLLKNNMDVKIMGDQTWSRSPTVAANNIAKQYVEQAYAFMKPNMSPQEWDKFVEDKSKFIPNEINNLRRGALTDPATSGIVEGADASMAGIAKNAIAGQAEKLASQHDIKSASDSIAETVLTPANQIRTEVSNATDKANIAAAELEAAKNDALLAPANAKVAWAPGQFATASDTQETRNKLTQTLTDKMEASDKAVAAAYEQIPRGLDYDRRAIAKAIIDGHITDDIGRILRNNKETSQLIGKPPIGRRFVKGGSPVQQVAETLKNIDLRTIFKELRGDLSTEIKGLKTKLETGNFDTFTRDKMTALINLKEEIDNQATKYGTPEFKAATAAHIKDMSLMRPTRQMNQLAGEAVSAGKKPGNMGKDDLLIDGRQLLDHALDGGDKSGRLLQRIVEGLTSGGDANTHKLLVNHITDLFSSAIAQGSKDGLVTARSIQQAAQPYLQSINQLAPELGRKFDDLTQILNAKEMGSKSADAELSRITAESLKKKAGLHQDIAFNFIEKDASDLLLGMGGVKLSPGEAYKQIFSDTNKTVKLLDRADSMKNPAIMEAIRSQYLRQLSDDLFTNRVTSATGKGSFINEGSLGKLSKFTKQADTTPSDVFDMIFSAPGVLPHEKEDAMNLIKEFTAETQARDLRPNTRSSNTAQDTARLTGLRTIVAGTLGILNRTATMVNKIGGALIKADMKSAEQMRNTLGPALLTNTKELTAAIDKYIKDPGSLNDITQKLASLSYRNPMIKGAVTSDGLPFTDKGKETRYNTTQQALGQKVAGGVLRNTGERNAR